MPTIVVGNRQITMPSPIYVLPETIEVSVDAVQGKCLFPSSDPTVGERGDHANVCHSAFALWNAAHAWAQINGHRRLFATNVNQKVRGLTPPDTIIDFVAQITKMRRHGGQLVGSVKATFRLSGRQRPLLEMEVNFIEEKA